MSNRSITSTTELNTIQNNGANPLEKIHASQEPNSTIPPEVEDGDIQRSIVIARMKDHFLSANIVSNRVVEMRIDQPTTKGPRLHEIYVGRVSAVKEGLHAAFIDIAPGVTCYYDLKEVESAIFTTKLSKKPIVQGEELLVQVSREAWKTKLPAVSTNLSFFSKNLILTTGKTVAGISSKIEKERREELRTLLEVSITENYGFLARTSAAQVDNERLIREIGGLICKYEAIVPTAATRKCYSRLLAAETEYEALLRDQGSSSIKDIITDDTEVYETLSHYLQQEMPEQLSSLRLYEDPTQPLYKHYGLDKVLSDCGKEQVWLKSGGYLIIQPTEALTVIDVNTGKADTQKKKAQFRKINGEAAVEIARQMRLRNLSGIILVDFINMEDEEDRREIADILRREFRKDPVPTTYVDTTALQLVEITRKKVRKPLRDYRYLVENL